VKDDPAAAVELAGLANAQLAVAQSYGLPSWQRLAMVCPT
jgi:hypothetical protein